MSERMSLLQQAQNQLERLSTLLNLEPAIEWLIKTPALDLRTKLPLKLGHGDFRLYDAYRVQHSTACGPSFGELWFQPDFSIEDCQAQALRKTWQTALLDLPLGGACGGVRCDLAELDRPDQENLARAYLRRINKLTQNGEDILTPGKDIPPAMMNWMEDEQRILFGQEAFAVVGGRSGAVNRAEATGYGLAFVLREAFHFLGFKGPSITLALDGFDGFVLQAMLALSQALPDCRITQLALRSPADSLVFSILAPQGIDLQVLPLAANGRARIDLEALQKQGYKIQVNERPEPVGADILILAQETGRFQVPDSLSFQKPPPLIAELGQGILDDELHEQFYRQEILVLPEILCEAGAVICDYLNLIQNREQLWWDRQVVVGWIDQRLRQTFQQVAQYSRQEQLAFPDAALLIALERLLSATQLRGWI